MAKPPKPQPAEQRFAEETAGRVRAFCTEARSVEDIAAHLGVEATDAFRDWLESLAFSGRLLRLKGRRYETPKGHTAVGTFRRSRQRGSFVVPVDASIAPIDIPPGHEEGAQDGDRVLASYREAAARRGRRANDLAEGLTGRVLGIVDARAAEAVGIFEFTHDGRPRVRLEGYNLPRYAWCEPHEARRCKPGMVVRVKLLRKPDANGRARASLLGSVGSIDDPLHDLDNLVALFGYPGPFSPEALEQVAKLPEDPSPEDMKGRLDLRDRLVITIDPRDAKDHDDAISLQALPGGLTLLGVHIADVARYVTPGSALDEDARFRATSVYLPGRLIPMLPPELSAGLCSLHDRVDRLAKSCFMVFDAEGRMLRREVLNTVIRVHRFLTYEEVLPVLQGKGSTNDAAVDELLVHSRRLADLLLKRRLERGALMLEIPRPHVYVDQSGRATSVEPESHDIAHNLIEEFMLIANEAVACFLIERGLPYIGRIHPPPLEDAIEDFWEFCDELKVPQPDFDTPGALQRFLEDVKKRPGYDAIHYALLRSLTRAIYAAEPDLHYALATDKYVHFTSPIRRYPDTVTHQVLDQFLEAGGLLRWQSQPLEQPWVRGDTGVPPKAHKAEGKRIPGFAEWEFSMPHIAAHCTERSIRADQGSLAADQIKILRLVQGRIGEEVMGTVIGVSAVNVQVRLDLFMAEGYVDFRDLSDGWVEAHRYWAVYETRAGVRRLMMGDRVEVEIADVDLGSRSLRLLPLGEHTKERLWGARGGDRRKHKGDRREHRRKRR
ncbi:MAG: RNB domain-containing ribonuclease [Planctomycetes bacterium]|nr:RNB domain-containing ribonuclease [Planctomycetota bacterium]